MQISVSWQMVVIYTVTTLVVGGLILKGLIPSAVLIGLAGWLIPSPAQAKRDSSG